MTFGSDLAKSTIINRKSTILPPHSPLPRLLQAELLEDAQCGGVGFAGLNFDGHDSLAKKLAKGLVQEKRGKAVASAGFLDG